jgi:hypothetical protein
MVITGLRYSNIYIVVLSVTLFFFFQVVHMEFIWTHTADIPGSKRDILPTVEIPYDI